MSTSIINYLDKDPSGVVVSSQECDGRFQDLDLRGSLNVLLELASRRDFDERAQAEVFALEENVFVSQDGLEAFARDLVVDFAVDADVAGIDLSVVVQELVSAITNLDFSELSEFANHQRVEPASGALRGNFPVINLLNRLLDSEAFNIRAELVRRALIARKESQESELLAVIDRIASSAGVDGLQSAIARLERIVGTQERGLRATHDLPESSTPANTRIHRALSAIRNLLAFELSPEARNVDLLERLRKHTAVFVINVLNPDLSRVDYFNITDVNGAEANVPSAENDYTRVRAESHLRSVAAKYGVEHVNVFQQGASINCPEQCGAYAAVALAQAARVRNRNVDLRPQVVVLNNAARVKSADGIDGDVEEAKSTPLVFARFRIAGVEHTAFAYGYQTLTCLKPFITELYEFEGSESGSQFRSLEIEQHIAMISSVAGGALPTCYKIRPLELDRIPDLNLGEGEFLYLGDDKFGNGVLAIAAEDLFSQYLDEGECATRVRVTISDRETGAVLSAPTEYALGRDLGKDRTGAPAIWRSSTPDPADIDRGLANIGVFKESRNQINPDTVGALPGAVIKIEKITA